MSEVIMVALLETQLAGGTFAARGKRYNIDVRRTDGCKLAVTSVRKHTGFGSRRRYGRALEAALAELNRMGVRLAVLTRDFDGVGELERFGLSLPDERDVFLKRLPQTAVLCADALQGGSGGGLRIAVLAGHAGADTERTVAALLPYTRRLFLSAGHDSSRLCYRLRRDYGVAAQADPSPSMLGDAELAVCLTPWKSDFKPKTPAVLILAAGYESVPSCRCVDGVRLASGHGPAVPDGADEDMWNNAMLLCGSDIPVKAPMWGGRTLPERFLGAGGTGE